MLDRLLPGPLFEEIFNNAEKGYSHVTDQDVFNVEGLSHLATRCTINMLCRACAPVTYLEVGTFRGATFAAAMSGNAGTFIGVDDFCEFNRNGGFSYTDTNGNLVDSSVMYSNREAVDSVVERFGGGKARFIEKKFQALDMSEIPTIDIFLYDAGHSAYETEMGLVQFAPKLAPNALILVDDIDRAEVMAGVMGGCVVAGLKPARLFVLRGEKWNEGLLVMQRYG